MPYYSKPNDDLWVELLELVRDVRSALARYTGDDRAAPPADAPSRGAELLTVRDVAGLLGLSESTLAYWRFAGRGPVAYKLGSRVRYRRAEVESWLVANRVDSGTEVLELQPPDARRGPSEGRGAFCAGSGQPPTGPGKFEPDRRGMCSACRDSVILRNDGMMRKHHPL